MKPLVKTGIFIVVVPGTAAVLVPYLMLRGRAGNFPTGWRWAGTALLALGAIVVLWCMWDFATVGRGTPAPFDPPRTLVKRGLYRWVRNPMYLGVLLVLGGEAILFASRALAEYASGAALGFHLFVLFYEERTLTRKFGADYAAYRRNVSRWIPRPPRGK